MAHLLSIYRQLKGALKPSEVSELHSVEYSLKTKKQK